MISYTFRLLLIAALASTASVSCGQDVTFDSGSRFMLVGDSFSNGTFDWAGHVNASPEFDVRFFAVGGRTLAAMDLNFDGDYATAIGGGSVVAVVIAGGVNDVIGNRTAEQMRASVESMIGKTNGEHIILTTIAPFRGATFWTQGRQDVADEHDAWVQQLAASDMNISIFDIRAILDQNDDQIIEPEFASSDNFHPQACRFDEDCGMSHIADSFIDQFRSADILLGDVSGDGMVNILDINSFIVLLMSGGFQAEADINQDNLCNILDIGPFIEILNSN